MPANTNILALLDQNMFVRTKGSRSSIFCLEHTLLLLQPFISCKCFGNVRVTRCSDCLTPDCNKRARYVSTCTVLSMVLGLAVDVIILF